MLACTILPFLPLIVDAHIRQLGDDKLQKRQAAATFLHKTMRTSRGLESGSIAKKLFNARNTKHDEVNHGRLSEAETIKNWPILKTFDDLYEKNRHAEALLFPYLELRFDLRTATPQTNGDKEDWRTLQAIFGDILNDVTYWMVYRNLHVKLYFACKNLTGEKVYRLWKIKEKFQGGALKATSKSELERTLERSVQTYNRTDRFIKSKR